MAGTLERKPLPATNTKRMTLEELAERRRKGLCFHYNDKFRPGHNFPKLFNIEACWDEDDEDVVMEIEDDIEESTPKISLHAMAGIQTPQTMIIWGGIKRHSVMVLVDSRSTHNFVSLQTAQHVNLQPNSNKKLEVLVA